MSRPDPRRPVGDRRRRAPLPLASALGLSSVLVLATSLLLSGCVGIPTSGPVHQGGGIANERDDPFTRVIVQPPRPGMKPDDVVKGFLLASASFDGDHAGARLFLTPDAARTWDPADGVVVYDTSSPTAVRYDVPTSDSVRFSAPSAGRISVQGEYVAQTSGTVHVDFKLRQVGGEWRIDKPPSGLLLNTFDVGRSYRPYDVYFPDPSRTVLVPEQVLVPVGPGVSTSLVQALLAGPSPWLAPAVRTAVPDGTKLVVDSAPVRDGVAFVNLTQPAAGAVGTEAAAMSAQFVWTLRQLAGVGSLRITVEDVPFRAPGVGSVQTPDVWPTFDPDGETANADAFYEASDRLEVLQNDQAHAVAGPAGDGRVPLAQPAVSFDETEVAGLDATGRRLVVGRLGNDATLRTVLRARSLVAPSWDRFRAVWTVDRTPRGPVVWQVPADAAARRVEVRNLPAGEIEALRVARDGVRVLVVVRDATDGGSVYVGRIERAGARPVVAGFRKLATHFADVIGASWASADRIVLLASATPGATAQPWVVDMFGAVQQSLGPVPGKVIVSVTAAPTHPVLVSTEDGILYWFTGVGWDELGAGASPAYPG